MDQFQCDRQQCLLAVGEVRQHDPAHQSDDAGPVEHRHAPQHRDHLQTLNLAVVPRCHVSRDDVGHAGITETDPELADDEAPKGGADAVAAGRQKVRADRTQTLDQGTEAAEARHRVQRQSNQGAGHQEPLEEVGPGDGAESAERGHQRDDHCPDDHTEQVAGPALEREDRGEGLAGGRHLGRDVAHHRDQDDGRGGQPDDLPGVYGFTVIVGDQAGQQVEVPLLVHHGSCNNAAGSVTLGDTPHFWAAPFEQDGEFGGAGWPTR